MDNKKMMVSVLVSDYGGWKFVALNPSDIVREYMRRMYSKFWIIMVLALMVGVVLAYILAYRRSRPLMTIVQDLNRASGQATKKEKYNLDFLQESVQQLIVRDEALNQTIQEYLPEFRVTFFERLLKGQFSGDDEIEVYGKHLDISQITRNLVVLIIRINGYTRIGSEKFVRELHVKKALLKKVLKQLLNEPAFIYDTDFDRIAVLFTSKYSDSERLLEDTESICRKILYVLSNQNRSDFSFAAGNPVKRLLKVSTSYEQARQAIEYKALDLDKILVWYGRIPKEGQSYYPVNLGARLMNCTRSGDYKIVGQIIDQIYLENVVNKHLSCAGQRQLVYVIINTLSKLVEYFSVYDQGVIRKFQAEIAKIEQAITLRQMFKVLRGVYRKLCIYADGRKHSHNLKLRDEITDFLHKNYTDVNLYLPTVAEKFGITKVYLSQFFKEQTGENFSVCLERLRIEHAAKMLACSEDTVETIARESGYNSARVFRKAFKRVHGITPSVFRVRVEVC